LCAAGCGSGAVPTAAGSSQKTATAAAATRHMQCQRQPDAKATARPQVASSRCRIIVAYTLQELVTGMCRKGPVATTLSACVFVSACCCSCPNCYSSCSIMQAQQLPLTYTSVSFFVGPDTVLYLTPLGSLRIATPLAGSPGVNLTTAHVLFCCCCSCVAAGAKGSTTTYGGPHGSTFTDWLLPALLPQQGTTASADCSADRSTG
jgi:hypothetical protein